ncbi:protein FAM13A isoform X2 [Drosophila obscura]|uniref:protein FAM13A isoform X2 n=1 Tax=Drosophila obscura TaxID=7282 RepID=UPI001BB2423C|nr:protein FAM13A isoform X2 [Drosophila obscura]
MTPRIITYFLCGMRHPTTGLNEDDLSRLTGSSSSTASCGSAATASSSSSSASASSAAPTQCHEATVVVRQQQSPERTKASLAADAKNHLNSADPQPKFSSTYLPEIINPLEWQKSSRKRKERLDSSSVFGQDRKLQRSNSEELLTDPAQGHAPQDPKTAAAHLLEAQCEVIRRVSSEDFERTASYANYCLEFEREQQSQSQSQELEGGENNSSLANLSSEVQGSKERPRSETSPARQQREASDDSECEHERRRSSERFCKSRLPPGRKSGVTKKGSGSGGVGGKYLPSRRDEQSTYKYDLSALKYERRGFISSRKQQQQQLSNSSSSASDHNDNNLIDFHQQQQLQQQHQQQQQPAKRSSSISPTPTTSSSAGSDDTTPTPVKAKPPQRQQQQNPDLTSAQESLPWERGDEPAPVLSRRYAHSRPHVGGNIDAAAQLAKVMPYPQALPKQATSVQLHGCEDMDCLEPMDAVRAFSSLENIRTRDVMQQVLPAMMVAFQTPEERLKAISRRVTVFKKKLVQLEDALEQRLGYRPSQAERLNDKYMKNVLAELSKLRKERHELKTDPIAALGLKLGVGGGAGAGGSGCQEVAKKLERMKATLAEIEQNLNEKRTNSHRSQQLEELTADQLVQEKTAVQHGLLYFENLYGHPISKEERDAARPLYDRYRQLKRMVARTVMFGPGTGVPELPTILEHEAMVFEATSTPLQYSSNNSTETTNSPSDSMAPNTLTQNASSDESTTTTTGPAVAGSMESSAAERAASENISALSLDQLWEQLERVRDEKAMLKATIREYESLFEEQNGRKMLKQDRRSLETETYAQYKEKKAKVRLLQALIKKHIGH